MVEFHLTAVQILTLLVGTVSPVLVNLVTSKVTSNSTKAYLLLVLSAVTGLGGELLNALKNDVTYDLGAGLLFAVTNFIVGVAMYHGLWKTIGVANAASNALGGSAKQDQSK